MINVDPVEIEKFSQLAHRWWDPHSEFKPLHEINPLRLDYIDRVAPLAGKQVLDVGCGGGILAESMAARSAKVTGIDQSERALKVAQLHLLEKGLAVNYRCVTAEALAAEMPGQFDTVTCMEMLEHVPDPASVVASCSVLVRPGGYCFFSTIHRNLKAYVLAVLGAEYLLGLLPRGTHDYARFVTPSELGRYCRNASLDPVEVIGMTYNPLTKVYALGPDASVNYILCARKS
ncbi:MAG: bifunctional 2-polyprenyl-6-hydroxyphenol methylase/3-demethylubiquinol 3-O-methyltransferase UbiG [Burkholderiales bacterium]